MLKYVQARWSKNRNELERALSEELCLHENSYGNLVRLIVKHILNAGENNQWDENCIRVIGDLEIQGMVFYLIPRKKTTILRPEDYLITYLSCSEDKERLSKGWKRRPRGYMELCKKIVDRLTNPFGYTAGLEAFYQGKMKISRACVEYLKPRAYQILSMYPRLALSETRECNGFWIPYAWVTGRKMEEYNELESVSTPIEMVQMRKAMKQLVEKVGTVKKDELYVVDACNIVMNMDCVESVPFLKVINGEGVEIVDDICGNSQQGIDLMEAFVNCLADKIAERCNHS